MPRRTKTIAELRRELRTKERALGRLVSRHKKLAAHLAVLDRRIASLGGAALLVGAGAASRGAARRRGRRKRATGKPLVKYIRAALARAKGGMRAKDVDEGRGQGRIPHVQQGLLRHRGGGLARYEPVQAAEARGLHPGRLACWATRSIRPPGARAGGWAFAVGDAAAEKRAARQSAGAACEGASWQRRRGIGLLAIFGAFGLGLLRRCRGWPSGRSACGRCWSRPP